MKDVGIGWCCCDFFCLGGYELVLILRFVVMILFLIDDKDEDDGCEVIFIYDFVCLKVSLLVRWILFLM